MNVSEADDLNVFLGWLLGLKREELELAGMPDRWTEEGAMERLMRLADRAHSRLGAGVTGDMIREFWPHMLLDFPVRTCRVCGCTDEFGCDGGCEWVEEDLCSACVEAEASAPLPLASTDGDSYHGWELQIYRAGPRGMYAGHADSPRGWPEHRLICDRRGGRGAKDQVRLRLMELVNEAERMRSGKEVVKR